MGISRAEYQIHMRSTADVAGFEATIAKLEGQIAATEALGKSTKALQAELAKAHTTNIQAELDIITGRTKAAGAAAQEAAGGVNKFELSHRQLHAVLSQVAPGLAGMIRFLTSGFAGAIGVCLIAFQYLNEKIKEFSQLVDDLAGSDQAAGGWAQQLADNLRASHVEANVLVADIQRVLNAQETVAAKTDQLIARQKQQAEAAMAVGDAQKELEEARLALAEKLGEVTPEKVIKIKLDIDEEDFRRKQEAKLAGIKAELEARTKEREALAGGTLEADQDNVNNARLAAEAAKAAKEKNDTQLTNARENLKAAQADMAKADQRLMQPEFGKWDPRRIADEFERAVAEKSRENAAGNIAGYQREIAQLKPRQEGLDTAYETAKGDLEQATARWKEDAKATHDLTQTINGLTASLAGAQAEAKALVDLHNRTAETRAQGEMFDQWQKIMEAIQAGSATAEQQQKWAGLINAIQSGRATPEQRGIWGDLGNAAFAPRGRAIEEQFARAPGVDIDQMRGDLGNARTDMAAGTATADELRAYHSEVLGYIRNAHASKITRDELERMRRELEADISALGIQISSSPG